MAAYRITKTGQGVIPAGETCIKKNAFKNCKALTGIVIPEGVTMIDEGAFKDCVNLSSITLPNSLEDICWESFSGCKALTSIFIPENVSCIEPLAFIHCDNLRTIAVAEGNKHYDSRNNCNAIIETETNRLLYGCVCTIVPDTVTEIDSFAFSGCKKQDAVSMIEDVTSDQVKKVSVTFKYEGQYIFYVQGECTVEMTAEELILFNHLNQQCKEDEVEDVLEFFKEHMHKSLYDEIRYAIKRQIRYNDAKETVEREGRYCFEDMDEDEYESMTMEELIDRYLDDNADGIIEFLIEYIEIKSDLLPQ